MKTIVVFFLSIYAGWGQILPPEIPKKDSAITDRQALDIFKVVRAITAKASEVVYPVYSGKQRIAYGVSLGDEMILAKLSEVGNRPRLVVLSRDKVAIPLEMIAAYPEQDLVVALVKGLRAPAADWSDGSDLLEGSFLAAVRPDGEAQGIGVKSVAARSLRAADQGFLGVQLDARYLGEGVQIFGVVRDSAADEAGIRAGDVILKVNDEPVKGFHEVSTRLKRLRAGETPEILVKRGESELLMTPKLQGSVDTLPESRRLQAMDSLSGSRNRVRGNFPNVLQSDMELEASDTGLPVIDLKGRVIGMVIARAGRISTLVLPSDDIKGVFRDAPIMNDASADYRRNAALIQKLKDRYVSE
ncbi:MAG: PDZ domain-containing protein [Verrucomicrobiaceae bacterium]